MALVELAVLLRLLDFMLHIEGSKRHYVGVTQGEGRRRRGWGCTHPGRRHNVGDGNVARRGGVQHFEEGSLGQG